MDSKLKDAIEKEDWYSAHQIYLALAQKHQRGKRQSELVNVLVEGTITLAQAGQVNSANQLADKLVSCLDASDARLANVFQALWEMNSSSAVTFGNAVVEKLPNTAELICRAGMCVGCEQTGRYALLAKDLELIKEIGEAYLEDAWCRLVVRCLISKNFLAASSLISAKLSGMENRKTIDDSSGALPSFTAITEKSFVNFCELLFMVCQRKCDKSLFWELLKAYEGVVKIPEDWIKALESTFWPPVSAAQTSPMNPLAQMMQNFMRPPPQQPPASQNINRRIDDLD